MVTEPKLYGSFEQAVADVLEMNKEGWQVDFDKNPPSQYAFKYEITYTREVAPEPKRSRAEILADARAAKAAKKGEA